MGAPGQVDTWKVLFKAMELGEITKDVRTERGLSPLSRSGRGAASEESWEEQQSCGRETKSHSRRKEPEP